MLHGVDSVEFSYIITVVVVEGITFTPAAASTPHSYDRFNESCSKDNDVLNVLISTNIILNDYAI